MAVNFYDLCRVCTANSEQKINIFSVEARRKNLSSKVAECLALNIEEKDRLPKVICAQCVQHVESNMEFRSMCKKSQATLTSWLNSATSGKVYIKDEVAPGTGKSLSVLGNTAAKQMPLSTVVQSFNQQPTIFQSNDLLNSIMQVAGLQQQNLKINQTDDKQQMQQYTITVDNKFPKTMTFDASKLQQNQQQQTFVNEKDAKTNALEEFLKLKPNIKVTPIKRDAQKQQQQPQQQQPQQQQLVQNTPQQITIQAPQLPMQSTQQTATQLPQQLTTLQFQQLLQQQLQQQWQQQQLQHQLQQLTQLQPQQITITAPTAPLMTQTSNADTTPTTTATLNDSLSPCKSKKINFVLTPPSTSQATSTTTTMLPQFTTTTASTTTGQQQQIQLQFQPTMSTLQQQQTQHQQQELQQQQQQSQTNALLSNLAPFLQQTVGVTTPMGATANTTLLSPNKCFLPITIKDENSDQQIVAHIDAKNFVFPTTYQLQMKLQPQIATVDGQPIMQLTPTSIPATLQLTPQALTNQTFQALLNTTNNLQSTQMLQTQQQAQQQQPTTQMLQAQQTTQHNATQQFSQPIITSQQIIRPANGNFINNNITNDVATSTNEQHEDNTAKQKTQTISQQKYKITQLPGNTIEITPANDFQPTQQQQQPTTKPKTQQQLQTITAATLPNSVPTQYGGITVQRISTAAKASANNKVNQQQQQQQVATTSTSTAAAVTSSTTTTTTAATATASNVPKANVWNKQNVTISRVSVQAQSQQTNQQQQQQQAKVSQNNKSPQATNKVARQSVEQATTTTNAAKKLVRRIPSKSTTVTKPTPTQQQETTNAATTTSSTTEAVEVNNRTPTSVTSAKIETTVTPASSKVTKRPSETNTAKTTPSSGAATSTTTPEAHTTSKTGFVCNQCQRVFKKKEHLTQHIKLHAGIRPFKCSQDGCDKDFSRKEHLLRHLVSHTGQKMFSCEVCQKPFSRKDNLNKHKRIHSVSQNYGNYFCDVCNKSFTVKAYYEEHMAMHTKQESTTDAPPPKKKPNNNNNNSVAQRTTTLQQQQQQQPTQQIQIVQQQTQQQQQNQQQQQIMHLQLPTVVTTQDLAGNTITITQSSEPNKAIGTHDATVLNLPSHLANFVQLGQTQFVNASTGQIVGHIKIDK